MATFIPSPAPAEIESIRLTCVFSTLTEIFSPVFGSLSSGYISFAIAIAPGAAITDDARI